jgi:predicted dehydrogenase
MLRVALIGLGFMGRAHLENYIRLEAEGYPVKLVAICDIDKSKFEGKATGGNLDVGNTEVDFSKYNLYTDIDEMLEKEELDYIDTPLPSYLHAEIAVKGLNKGLHVFCEKPMALKSEDCLKMIEAAQKNNKQLMIGQCLRFWPEYEFLKECVDTEKYGKTLSGYFYRGGVTPTWSYENWLLQKEKSGGCLFDQHVHDVDTINWLFGKPTSVSTIGKNVIEGNGYDIVSTNYKFEDGKVINAQDDWVLNGDYGFSMTFRVNFEKGNMVYEKGKLVVNPNDGKAFTPELSKDDGYYREMKYFIKSLVDNTPITVADTRSTMQTIKIAEAEQASADDDSNFKAVK